MYYHTHILRAADISFVFTVKTDNAGTSASDQFTVPTNSGSFTYNYNVDWGDGTKSVGLTGNHTHTFAGGAGTYTVRIKGIFPTIRFNNGGDKLKFLSITQWGKVLWSSFNESFSGCSNLNVTANDIPRLTSVTSLLGMFRNCSSLVYNTSINSWMTQLITNMGGAFDGCSVFNQPLNSWNTGNVTDMNAMFRNCTVFNQSINSWNTAKVTDMNRMFLNCVVYNQSMNSWNTALVTSMQLMFSGCTLFNGNITSWNTIKVVNFASMFASCPAFNQNIGSWNTVAATSMASMFDGTTIFNQNIGSWNTALVTNMSFMFRSCPAFNQDLSAWNTGNVTTMQAMFRNDTSIDQSFAAWDVEAVTNMADMFNGATLSTANYDATLVGWAAQTVQTGVNFHGGNSTYTLLGAGGTARTTLIVVYSWTITDGGGV